MTSVMVVHDGCGARPERDPRPRPTIVAVAVHRSIGDPLGMKRPSTPRILLVAWGLFIVYGTTLPFDLTPSADTVAEGWRSAHKIPWADPSGGFPSVPDAVANVLLFLPWGFLIGLGRAERRRTAGATILLGGVSALVCSLSVEFLQLFSTSRTSSATDLCTNAVGGTLGAALGWVAGTRYRLAVGPWLRDRLRRDPWSVLAGAIAAGALLWAVAPFDFTLDVGDVKSSLKSLRLIPFGPPLRGAAPPLDPAKLLASLLAWIPIGGVFALTARNGLLSRRTMAGAVFGLAVAVELVQLLIASHATDATSVFLFCVGGAIGWGWVTARPTVKPRAWAGAGLAIWTAATLVAGFSPWQFASPDFAAYGPERFLPFIYYFLRTDVHALGDAVAQILLYLPLGLLADKRAVLVGAVVAAAVEGGQRFVVGRVADVTDVALGILGAGAGTWLVRRALAASGAPAREG